MIVMNEQFRYKEYLAGVQRILRRLLSVCHKVLRVGGRGGSEEAMDEMPKLFGVSTKQSQHPPAIRCRPRGRKHTTDR